MAYLVNARHFAEKGDISNALVYYNKFKKNCKEISHCIDYNLIYIKNNLNYVISLTSYPKRIGYVHLVIESLLNQSEKNIQIILWLAHEEFPEKENSLPFELKKLIGDKFHIEWCDNIFSYKKLIPALMKYKDKIIITADDDVIYPETWLSLLLNSYLEAPFSIHCHRGHKVKIEDRQLADYKKWPKRISTNEARFSNFATGVGGVLYPPNSLHTDVFNTTVFLELCRYGDDIWFWAMSVLNNTKIKIVKNGFNKFENIDGTQEDNLWEQNAVGGRNDIMMANIFKKYPEILVKLRSEEGIL